MSQLNPAPELHIIQLKEITPPITFVRPPFVKSNEPKPIPIAHQSSASSSSSSSLSSSVATAASSSVATAASSSSTTMKPVPSASSKILSKTKGTNDFTILIIISLSIHSFIN
ncbi:unnamed protein product [Rotaria socialis]|uniref:Uncharacterized protein n=2 Tax=Rotaria socialis TaxID=392032 RepID=A0A818GSQ4_9BILA|nr:unnamed protein product [Rotaria socialis]